MNYFNYLSPELIEIIFKKLDINNLINLRNVDKRFRSICENIKIKKLIVSNDNQYLKLWFHTNDYLNTNEDNLNEVKRLLNYKSIFKLENLKKLFINDTKFYNLTILNEFQLLEQLDLNINELNNNYELKLDNLRIAELYIENEDTGYKLKLNTIKLIALKTTNDLNDNFIFDYPDKILYYETNYYNCELNLFENLEYLKFVCEDEFDRDILLKFRNLKIIDFDIYLFDNEKELFENMKKDINFMIDQAQLLKRTNFMAFYNGVQLIDHTKVHEPRLKSNFSDCKLNILEFQINNYDLLKDNCWEYEDINYSDLMNLIKTNQMMKIPASFINKYKTINTVQIYNQIDDEEQFIKFLNNLYFLSKLIFKNCNLNQTFINKLIDFVYLNNLKHLEINENLDLQLNFDFLFYLKQLKTLNTNQKITNMNFIFQLIQNQPCRFMQFKIDDQNFFKIVSDEETVDIYSFYLDDKFKKIKNFEYFDLKLNDLISNNFNCS